MKEIELMFDLPIDWRGYLKFVLPALLFGLILILSIGVKTMLS